MNTIITQHDYPVEPQRLWALATDYDALHEIMKGIVSFSGLPEGRTRTGQKMNLKVSLFGKLPSQPYDIEILECDDDRMVMRSIEKGVGVNSWRHTLTVTEIPSGSRLTDKIEIDAGLFTPVFALWAKYLYNARHKPRLRILTAEPGA